MKKIIALGVGTFAVYITVLTVAVTASVLGPVATTVAAAFWIVVIALVVVRRRRKTATVLGEGVERDPFRNSQGGL